MKSQRKRILDAINHKEPDRVPLDLGGMRATGMSAVVYNKLKKRLDVDVDTKVFDVKQQLACIDEEIRKKLEIDTIPLDFRSSLEFGLNKSEWKKWILQDGSEALIYKGFNPQRDESGGYFVEKNGNISLYKSQGSSYFEPVYRPFAEKFTIEDIERYSFEPYNYDVISYIEKRARYLYKTTPYAIVLGFGGQLVELVQSLRGFENMMIDLAFDTKELNYLLDRLLEVHIENITRIISKVKNYIQIVQVGDDLGTQRGPQFSIEMYKRTFYPRHKTLWSYIKKLAPEIKLFLHSCGSIKNFLPLIVEAGIDIINPVQTSAVDMNPVELKRDFGNDLTFWGGGAEVQKILTFGTPQEVKDQVKERIEILGQGGGFVFSHIHNIQDNTPIENVLAMYDSFNLCK